MSGKYDPLNYHLKRQRLRRVRMSFKQIEKVLGAKLPPSAFDHRAWWANEKSGSHTHALAWLSAGYRVDEVDQIAGRVQFEAER